MTLPPFTNTAATIGFGEVAPQPRRANANARRIALMSLWSLVAVMSPCFVAADVRRLKIIYEKKFEPRHLGCYGSESGSRHSPGIEDQSISPAHQFLIEGMFARADAQEVKRLLNEPVGHFGILAELASQGLFARTQRGGILCG
jgi:hypothetical protein